MSSKETKHPRRAKLHGPSPTQEILTNRKPSALGVLSQHQRHSLNVARESSPGGEVKCESSILKFGTRLVFPFMVAMEKEGAEITPKSLRAILKRARDEKVLLPSQYRLAKEYALALLMEYRRLHPAPPLSSGTKVKD